MPSGGMRARPVDLHPCPVCEDKHEAETRIAGWPIVVCPKLSGDAVRFQAGWLVLVAGTPKK